MKRIPKQVATGLATLTDLEKRLCAVEDEVFGELPEPEIISEPVKPTEAEQPEKKTSKLDRLNPKAEKPKKAGE